MAAEIARHKGKDVAVAVCGDPRNNALLDNTLSNELRLRAFLTVKRSELSSLKTAQKKEGIEHFYIDVHGGCKAVKWSDEVVTNGTVVSVAPTVALIAHIQAFGTRTKNPTQEQLDTAARATGEKKALEVTSLLDTHAESDLVPEQDMVAAARGLDKQRQTSTIDATGKPIDVKTQVILMPSRLPYGPAFDAAKLHPNLAYATQLYDKDEIVQQVEVGVTILHVDRVVMIARSESDAAFMRDELEPALGAQAFMSGRQLELVQAF